MRSYSDEVRNHTVEAVKRITRGLAEAAGLPENRYPIVTVQDEFTPALFNNPELVRRVTKTIKGWLGDDRVSPQKPVMGGEDFSEYGRTEHRIPVCMLWLGAVEKQLFEEHQRTGKALPSLHSSEFRPAPEPAIKTGVAIMTAAVLDLAGKK